MAGERAGIQAQRADDGVHLMPLDARDGDAFQTRALAGDDFDVAPRGTERCGQHGHEFVVRRAFNGW